MCRLSKGPFGSGQLKSSSDAISVGEDLAQINENRMAAKSAS